MRFRVEKLSIIHTSDSNEYDESFFKYYLLDYSPSKEVHAKILGWLESLKLSKRVPKEFQLEVSFLKDIFTTLSDERVLNILNNPFRRFHDEQVEELEYNISRLGDLAKIVQLHTLFSPKSKETVTLKLDGVTFRNEAGLTGAKFKKASELLVAFLNTLKKPHSTTLKGLKIILVRKDKSTSPAMYKRDKDVVYIRPDRLLLTNEEYGSLPYVLLHELGHRYENKNKLKSKQDTADSIWNTTPYSLTDSLSGSEKFAELFAMSHWPKKYTKYKETIDLFLNTYF